MEVDEEGVAATGPGARSPGGRWGQEQRSNTTPNDTQPAAQPLRTVGGYLARAGAPAAVYVGSAYSMTVRDSRGALVLYAPQGGTTDAALGLDANGTMSQKRFEGTNTDDDRYGLG